MTVLVDVVDALREQIESLARTVESAEPIGLMPAQRTLIALVSGRRHPLDVHTLGLPLDGARLVLGVGPDEAWRTRLLATAEPGLVATPVGSNRVLAVVRNTPRRAGEDRGLLAAQRFAAAAVRCGGGDVAVGISTAVTSAEDLPLAYADASDAAALAARSEETVLGADEVWAQITLDRLRQQLPGMLTLANPLTRLAAHDERVGSELLVSLGTWLHNNQDTPATADELNVHPNTLRYRLRRATEKSGLDLGDGAQRLVAELADRCVHA